MPTGVACRTLPEVITRPIVSCHRQSDASPELRTLYFVLAQFLAGRGHPLPEALSADLPHTA